jgi:hypothetical protein
MVAAPLASGLHFPSSPLQPLAELEEDITCPPFQGWKFMSEDKEAHGPTKSPKQLHTEWLQWLKENEPTQQAKFVDIKDRRKEKSELSFNKNFKQANLYLRRGRLPRAFVRKYDFVSPNASHWQLEKAHRPQGEPNSATKEARKLF